MVILLKRWLMYLFIPAGLALLFSPLDTSRTEHVKKDFVFLKMSQASAKDRGARAMPIIPENPTEENVRQYMNEVQKAVSGEHSNAATTANPDDYPIIQKQTLAAYPALQKQIDHMLRMGHWSKGRFSSSRLDSEQVVEEWAAFKKAFLGTINGTAFQYEGRLFKARIKPGHTSIEVEIKNLSIAYKVAGGVLLLLGLILCGGVYVPPSKNLQIAKRSAMIIWDAITVAIGSVFSWMLLDSMLPRYFQTGSFLGDDQMALFMGVYWVSLGNLIMALFTTATSLQTLLITSENITVKGLFGKKKLSWSHVQDIQVAEYFMPRKVYGFFTPRKVSKILKISGEDAVTLRVMEPPYAATKNGIIGKLSEYAPQRLQHTIPKLSRNWLSRW